MSHCVTCVPAWLILYYVTGSCKGPIQPNPNQTNQPNPMCLAIFVVASGGDVELEGPTTNKDVTRVGVLLMYCDLLITQHMVCTSILYQLDWVAWCPISIKMFLNFETYTPSTNYKRGKSVKQTCNPVFWTATLSSHLLGFFMRILKPIKLSKEVVTEILYPPGARSIRPVSSRDPVEDVPWGSSANVRGATHKRISKVSTSSWYALLFFYERRFSFELCLRRWKKFLQSIVTLEGND